MTSILNVAGRLALHCLACVLVMGCGKMVPPPTVPVWARVAPEQIAEAARLGVPVAYEEPATSLRFVLVPGTRSLPAFYLSTTEVSNRDYADFDPKHRSTFFQDDHPVDMVSPASAAAFAQWLSTTGKHPGYRLPTEPEWEHACRAGTATAFSFGDQLTGLQANIHVLREAAARVRGRTAPVGSYDANRWGLFDMHGNLWEFCVPTAKASIFRGGSWRHTAARARSDSRETGWLAHADPDTGFRLARNVSAR